MRQWLIETLEQIWKWLVETLEPIRQWLGEALKPVAEWFFALVTAVPMWMVRVIFISILVAVAIWVLTLRRQTPENEDSLPFYKDLRWMALGVLTLQAILYLIF